MLTIEDCIALSDLTEEEIEAIAENKHLPEMVAVELGSYLIHRPGGERRIIVEDLAAARARGDLVHAAKLKLVLKHFLEHHAPRGAAAAPRTRHRAWGGQPAPR